MYSYKNTFVYLHIQKFRPAKTIKNGAISKSHKSREIKKQNKMEKVKMLLCGLVLFSTTTFVGCKKETGCTDSSATNFKSSAEKDDGNSTYKGSATFWNLTSSSLETVVVLMADNTSGNITVDYASNPDCGDAGCFTYTAAPGTYSYSAAEVSPGTSTWSGSVTITSKGCTTVKLY